MNKIELTNVSSIPSYTISNAARLLHISVHTLRMYEREGLLIPFKKESNQRLYSDKDLERIRCIRKVLNEDKIGIEGIRKLLSLIPCWGIVKCPAKERKVCKAYTGYSKPCWMLKHKNNVCESKNCRDCDVYSSFGNCESIKDKLKELIVGSSK
ncbi:MAG: MerR family transcriptional regulator [Ignavibacteriae bacterium HGW-Ignavibacteriae-3]|nr:MAG: MerR family transcriptional regulator [Ignavibacteriae bacterium HGW-Ignavibacteriae-3]